MKDYIKRIIIFLKDEEEKKSWWLILKEVLQLIWMKKQFPLSYFGRFFYKKYAPPPFDFMNMSEYHSIIYSPKLERVATSSLLSSKVSFALFCQANSLPVPELIGYNLYNSFIFNKKVYLLKEAEEFLDLCNTLLSTNHIDRIFVKASESKGGNGIFLLTKNSLSKTYKEIWATVKEGSYIFENAIRQHDEINAIFANSINTLRIETYLDKNNEVQILGGYMRFGTGKSYVDNVSSGGFFVPICFKEGKLHDKGFTAMINGSKTITEHPTTNYLISGFKIPFFQDAIKLCKTFARYIPNRIIGWDVAISPTGPIIIEGNHDAAIIAGELSYGGYKKHPVFEEIMSEI